MSYGDDFVLTLFTNSIEIAQRADAAGVNRIGLDLEVLNKKERQDASKAWISDHQVSQLPDIGRVLKRAKLFARSNPLNHQSRSEIDRLLDLGVHTLMLPMFRTAREAEQYVEIVAGRAEVSLLVETADAVENIRDIVKVAGTHEIHVGLNDLHLSLGLDNQFELLTSPLMERVSACVREAGLPFGFGGVGRINDLSLPVPSNAVYPQYPRLKADRALLSRVFLAPDHKRLDLNAEVRAFREAMTLWNEKTDEELQCEMTALAQIIRSFKRSGATS